MEDNTKSPFVPDNKVAVANAGVTLDVTWLEELV